MSSILDPKDITFDEDIKEPSVKQEEASSALSTSDISFEEEPSTLTDVARLGAQGALAGFSDEALGAIQSAIEVAGTEKTLKDLPSLYKQYRDIEREKIEQARETSPVLGTAAEIGGAILPSLFTGGTSLAVRGAAKFLPALVESKGAAAALGRAALTGAQYGGTAAAGATESPIFSSEGAEEIAKSAALGGVLGGVSESGLRAGKALYETFSPEYRTLKLTGTAFKEAAKGRPSPTSEAGEALLIKEEQEAQKEFVKKFFGKGVEKGEEALEKPGLREIQGKNIAAVAEKATSEGTRFDSSELTEAIGDLVIQLEKRALGFIPKEKAAIEALIKQGGFGEEALEAAVTPTVANEARRALFDSIKRFKQNESPEVLNVLYKLRDSLGSELSAVPGFSQANLKYQKSMEVLDELLGKRASGVLNIEKKTGEKVRKLIKQAEVLGETGVSAREKLNSLKNAAKKAFDLDPESFKKAGINAPEDLFAQIEKQAELASIRQGLGGVDRAPEGIGKTFGSILNLAHPYQLGRYAGMGAGAVDKTFSWVYKKPDTYLMKLADQLSNVSGLKHVAESLRESVASGNIRAKNVALFALMQRPDVKSFLKEDLE